MALSHFFSLFFVTSLLFLFVAPSPRNIIVAGKPIFPPKRPSFFTDFSGYKVASDSALPSPPGTSHKVNLSLYYESLCPYCQNFIVDPLAKAILQSDLMTILNLKLVPWGNAVLQDKKNIICQHGEAECYLNIIHACGINVWPDVKTHFNFIRCVEKQSSSMRPGIGAAEQAWQKCIDQLGLSKRAIQDCYDSGHGRELVLKYGNETDHLKPPHQYVPWVVVNDTPLMDDYMKFVEHVCKAYQGQPPEACTSSAHATTNSIEKKSPQSVCRPGESTRHSWIHYMKVGRPA